MNLMDLHPLHGDDTGETRMNVNVRLIRFSNTYRTNKYV